MVMQGPATDHEALLGLLPETELGTVQALEPIRMGLSGAGVYAVTTSRGAYVLRVQSPEVPPRQFAEQQLVLGRAASAGIAPAVVHVDEEARAVVSEKVAGRSLPSVLADAAEGERAIASVIEQLRALHALETSGISERDPLPLTRRAWEAAKGRPGFPAWAGGIEQILERVTQTLQRDLRQVVSHNDVNPGNLLWDGTRAWLVDWEVTGLTHPYYDLATFSMFLRLQDEAALALAASHDRAPLDDRSRESFLALRQLACLLCGLTFLGFVDDLEPHIPSARADVPTLVHVYAAIRNGQLQLHSARGQAALGLALLAWGCDLASA